VWRSFSWRRIRQCGDLSDSATPFLPKAPRSFALSSDFPVYVQWLWVRSSLWHLRIEGGDRLFQKMCWNRYGAIRWFCQ
jgi:hypothetical protein